MPLVLAMWLIEVGLISYRDLKDGNTVAGLPLPADFLATFVIFGGLALVPKESPAAKAAGLAALGVVVATVFNIFDPSDPIGTAKNKAATKTSKTTATTKEASSAS